MRHQKEKVPTRLRLLQLTCVGYVALIAYEFWLFGVVFGLGFSDAFPQLFAAG